MCRIKGNEEQKEAEAELEEKEVAKTWLEPAPRADEDIKARMDKALGIDFVQYGASVMPYSRKPRRLLLKEPVIES